MPERVAPCQSKCFGSPLIFLEFSRSSTKIKDKIRYLQLPLFYLAISLQGEVLDKERNSTFCCPKIACEDYCSGAETSLTLLKAELLQLV